MPYEAPHPLTIFMAHTQGRIRFRTPLVTYTNAFAPSAHTLWMSPQVEEVTGYRPEDWVDRPGFFDELVHEDDRAAVTAEMRRSREQLEPFSRDYRLKARDGREIWIHDESVPVTNVEGHPEFIQGYFIDITERKRLEEALRHAQKVEAVGRLAAGIAHDFNNVLTAIGGYAELAQRRLPGDHAVQRMLAEIRGVVASGTRLTRQLLAFSRRQELREQVVDLGTIVRELQSMLVHVAGPGARVHFDLSGTCPVRADVGQLEQVVVNLVANARDAIGEAGDITVHVGSTGRHGVLTVSDNGCGMPPEVVARIFDPFFTTKDRDAGTGLSTVQGIVEQGGGTIEVQSVPGEGTEIRILLPAVDLG